MLYCYCPKIKKKIEEREKHFNAAGNVALNGSDYERKKKICEALNENGQTFEIAHRMEYNPLVEYRITVDGLLYVNGIVLLGNWPNYRLTWTVRRTIKSSDTESNGKSLFHQFVNIHAINGKYFERHIHSTITQTSHLVNELTFNQFNA